MNEPVENPAVEKPRQGESRMSNLAIREESHYPLLTDERPKSEIVRAHVLGEGGVSFGVAQCLLPRPPISDLEVTVLWVGVSRPSMSRMHTPRSCSRCRAGRD